MNRLLFSIYLFLLPLAIFGQTEGSGDIQRIAESGNTDAQNDLGVLYYNGEGVAKDLAKAAEWYRKAAEKKHVRAKYNLGILYLDKEFPTFTHIMRSSELGVSSFDAIYVSFLQITLNC